MTYYLKGIIPQFNTKINTDLIKCKLLVLNICTLCFSYMYFSFFAIYAEANRKANRKNCESRTVTSNFSIRKNV